MYQESGNRGEKLSTVKLAVVQYGILLMMLALAAGLWRLQVLGANNFRALAEQNRIRKVPILAARGKLFDRESRLMVDNYPSVSCFLVREQNQEHRRRPAHDCRRACTWISTSCSATLRHYRASPGLSAHPDQAGHHRRRSRRSSRRTATSCRSLKPSTKSAGSIRATGLRRT